MTINDYSTDNQRVNAFENKIVLLNGTELECYPKAVLPEVITEDKMKLDTTGEFLRIGNKPFKKKGEDESQTADRESEEKFFLEHAFFFFENASRILQDSRMFLAPVPVRSGIAYTGTSGFHTPTLGVYIEWWLNCSAPVTKDEEGNYALTYHIAGSPLSGCNSCRCVYPDGTTKKIFHGNFSSVWSTFSRINSRYNEAKQRCESYSLQEVWEILAAQGQNEVSGLSTKLLIAEGRNAALEKKLTDLNERYNTLLEKYRELRTKQYQKVLEDFAEEYHIRERETNTQITALKTQMQEYKSQMKQQLIDKAEYKKLVSPLAEQQRNLADELNAYKKEQMDKLTSNGDITIGMILDALRK